MTYRKNPLIFENFENSVRQLFFQFDLNTKDMEFSTKINSRNRKIVQGIHQKQKLKELRNTRDDDLVEDSLEAIRMAAAGETNLFPLVIEALRNDCTLGEIISAMKSEFGTYMAPSGF